MLVVDRRNAEIAEKCSLSVDETQKIAGNCLSSVDETLDLPKIIRHPWMKVRKTLKIGFRPRPKSRKQQKERFGRGRKTKNGENCISAAAESLKMKKTAFRPRPKLKKR